MSASGRTRPLSLPVADYRFVCLCGRNAALQRTAAVDPLQTSARAFTTIWFSDDQSHEPMSNLKGSCLCGAVTFEVTGPIRGIGSCHCSKCRKVSGTAGNAQFIVPIERFSWVCGEEKTQVFKLSDGWGPRRCATCGSPIPDTYDGQRMWVQAGLMDDPLGTDIKLHIFCGSRADWDRESLDAQSYGEAPE
jgi:hypothetical protein